MNNKASSANLDQDLAELGKFLVNTLFVELLHCILHSKLVLLANYLRNFFFFEQVRCHAG